MENKGEVTKLELRKDLEFYPSIDGHLQIKDPINSQYYILGPREAVAIDLLKSNLLKQAIKEKLFQEGELIKILNLLKGYGLLKGHEKAKTKKKLKTFSEFLTFRTKLLNPMELLNKFQPHTKFLFSKTFVACLTCFFFYSFYVWYESNLSFISYGWPLIANSWLITFAVFAASLFTVLTMHEIAHGVALKHYNGKVTEMGLCMIYFLPSFYTDLSDIYRLESNKLKTIVMLAGPLMQCFIGCLFLCLWSAAIPHTFQADLLYIYTFASFSSLFINLNPFLKLDGYFILEFWTGIDNLRSKSWNYIFSFFKSSPIKATQKEKLSYLLYAPISVIYSAFLISWIMSFYVSVLVLPAPSLFITVLAGLIILYNASRLFEKQTSPVTDQQSA